MPKEGIEPSHPCGYTILSRAQTLFVNAPSGIALLRGRAVRSCRRALLHSCPGAEGGNRTLTSLRIHDFESCASAYSATSAYSNLKITSIISHQQSYANARLAHAPSIDQKASRHRLDNQWLSSNLVHNHRLF